jgi:hypothetical protein
VKTLLRPLTITAALLSLSACGPGTPGTDGLRDSFAAQLSANRFITDFQRNGDELTFSGPGAEGGVATWRVQIDSAVVEANDDPAQPYKGTVKSSWFSDNQPVVPRGSESHLPIELMANGLSQDCWAFWDEAETRWSWE